MHHKWKVERSNATKFFIDLRCDGGSFTNLLTAIQITLASLLSCCNDS